MPRVVTDVEAGRVVFEEVLCLLIFRNGYQSNTKALIREVVGVDTNQERGKKRKFHCTSPPRGEYPGGFEANGKKVELGTTNDFSVPGTETFKTEFSKDGEAHWTVMLQGTHKMSN